MSALSKLNSAIQAINDAERIMKRIRSSTENSDLQHQIKRAMRELDEAKQYVERARREVRDID